jgi:hypothetical protein
VPVRLQAPLQQKVGLVLFLGDGGHDIFIKSGRQAVGLDVGNEPMPIFLTDQGFDFLRLARHGVPVDSDVV